MSTTALESALEIDRRLRAALEGRADPETILGPLADFTGSTLGASGEGPGGRLWYTDAGWCWWLWGHQLRAVVNDWVAAGRVLDRGRLKELRQAGRVLFGAARQYTEVMA